MTDMNVVDRKKRISWITAECYLDVDLPIIGMLKESFDIYWQVILNHDSKIDNLEYINMQIPSGGNKVKYEIVKQQYRQRDPRNAFEYCKVLHKAKKFVSDCYYIANYQMPYGIILHKMFLPKRKVVVACHNVTTPKGASSATFTKVYTEWLLNSFTNIHVFSKNQYKVLVAKNPNKNVLLAPLAIKDYGIPTTLFKREESEIIRFLNFGIIMDYKRVDLLIEASEILYKRGYKNFKVRIAGQCNRWKERYADKIEHNEIFELNIKRIPNEDVANVFAESHYFVLPYQDIAQSGSITVAFRYNLPTLVSDIEPFKDFVIDGENGVTFRSGDVEDLADKMQYIIDHHTVLYRKMQENQRAYVDKEFSKGSIVKKYMEYLNKI